MNSCLDILPIKPPKEVNKLKREVNPILPDVATGSMMILISPVKTGKSTLISNLLLSPHFYKDIFDVVYIISNTINNDITSRFLKEQFEETVFDTYSDATIQNIINYQKTFSKKDQPKIAIILDDVLGSVPKNGMINHLASRYRHYNIGLLLFSSQMFRGLPAVVRANATHVICGSPNNNAKEMEKLSEELGGAFGGEKHWLKLYKKCAKKRYDFMFHNLDVTPATVHRNFTELIYTAKSNGEDPEEDTEGDSDSSSDYSE